jgi:hypothetical protein
VPLGDLALNTLFDLLHYSSEIDAQALSAAEGKHIKRTAPVNLAELTAMGRLRG